MYNRDNINFGGSICKYKPIGKTSSSPWQEISSIRRRVHSFLTGQVMQHCSKPINRLRRSPPSTANLFTLPRGFYQKRNGLQFVHYMHFAELWMTSWMSHPMANAIPNWITGAGW